MTDTDPLVVAPNRVMAQLWITSHPGQFIRTPQIITDPVQLRGVSNRHIVLVQGSSRHTADHFRPGIYVTAEMAAELEILQLTGAATVERVYMR